MDFLDIIFQVKTIWIYTIGSILYENYSDFFTLCKFFPSTKTNWKYTDWTICKDKKDMFKGLGIWKNNNKIKLEIQRVRI